MIGYVKHFNDGKTIKKTMLSNVTDRKLLKKYIEIWEKISSSLNKEFDSDPLVVYGDNDKYIKTKIKQYGETINTNFQGKKISKENESYKCLSLITIKWVKTLLPNSFRRVQI